MISSNFLFELHSTKITSNCIGIPPHAHQAKILKFPLNGNSIFFIVQKFNFIVLGKNVFLKLIAMGTAPLTL
ncbi:hypothetical protein COI77_09540 [Bacillus thuringiensis]|uniref:Uncharacterized protein n=1 Tax=Bacillus cereus TaxID=1396 RepID=A0A9X6UMD1_BACCE|nr:hypothetical protein BK710_31525 [Bacillus thuringiensis serovar sumiyoshiensis]PEB68877.1 hypothetical protein COM91_16075 [Bacillus thuringiensis]PEQ86671.1 hypothetical protein CN475_15660 [Bacillus cereus]PEB85184.1 hypothetical protein COM94_20835 [Bacillus thuringiensis]PEY81778.1 hypothetical protein CN351_26735 [Bacillus thuringiensis]